MEAALRAAMATEFYRHKFADADLTDFASLPTTSKAELLGEPTRFLTQPESAYTRVHQTSGTSTGVPLKWYDTPRNWNAMLGCWAHYFGLAELAPADVAFFPFSFGPFLGFWTAFEAAGQFGMRTVPAGGLSSTARLRLMHDHSATVVFCTPTYALHLAEVARQQNISLRGTVRKLIVAGEPGGAVAGTRDAIEAAWGARVLDHYGLTEVGPLAMEAATHPGGLFLHDKAYFCEVLQPNSMEPAEFDTVGELVVTTLVRLDSPIIRYRTGDLVRPVRLPDGQRWLAGGILGRLDDMLHIRGNNVYPTAIETIIRRCAGLCEYRLLVDDTNPLADLVLEVEAADSALLQTIANAIRDALLFRCDVRAVDAGTLPRSEMKSRRIVKFSQRIHPPH